MSYCHEQAASKAAVENNKLETSHSKDDRRTELHGTMQRFHWSDYLYKVEQWAIIPGSRQTHSIKKTKYVTWLLSPSLNTAPPPPPFPSLLWRKESYSWCKQDSGGRDKTSHGTGEKECRVMEKWNSPVVQACRLNLKHPEQMGEG